MSDAVSNRFCIRRCRLEEAEDLLALWRQAGATVSATDTVEDIRQALADGPARVLVAEIGGRIVGSVIGSFDGWRGNIYRLVVHPDHRQHGIARALVHEVQQQLAIQGARRMTALVEKNHPVAMAFWQAVGYTLDTRLVRFTCNLANPLVLAEEDPDSAAARVLIQHLSAELGALYGDDGSGAFRSEDVRVPGAAFLVARWEGQPVGCGALRPLAEGIGEIKRMFVEPSARGRGIARRILAALEAVACRYGYRCLRLETGIRQIEAIRLYESAGFLRIPCYGKYSHTPLSICFEKPLSPTELGMLPA
ncbi:MAG TPA: GNAT family N-acetyltransferase [Gemmataceae bacterium]|nr:GNAT family N-acetyltransferase [Gemmataceae bacterium]